MIKKEYQKPTTKVVKLQHRSHILAGSPATLEGHRKRDEETEDTWYDLQ